MTKPPLTVLREILVSALPTTVAVKADSIALRKVWMTEPPKDTPFPCWIIGFGPEADLTVSLDEHESKLDVVASITAESHTYSAGDQYTKLDEKDISHLTTVKGTFTAAPNHIFTQGTDYQLADEDGDGAMDAVQWLSGGDKPDNGTAVLTTYDHKLLQPERAHLWSMQVIIHAAAQPLAIGQQGATEKHRATEVVEAMQSAVKRLYMGTIRPALAALTPPIATSLEFKPGTPKKLEGTDTVQAASTFEAFYEESANIGTPYRTARKADATATVTPQ